MQLEGTSHEEQNRAKLLTSGLLLDSSACPNSDAETTVTNFDDNNADDAAVLAEMISALRRLPPDSRQRLIETISTFFNAKLPYTSPTRNPPNGPTSSASAFSETRPITAKQFVLEKEPRTDVERIACLAFYLTHYADTPHFKTVDLSRLNTEAAQPKFSNAAVSVENATKMGYLVPAIKGHKQLSAVGERFVQALPDREAAKAAMNSARSRARRRTGKKVEA
jgi:hypothetical protein